MRAYRYTTAPKPLRSSTVKLDNVALVPASLLPFKAEWQAVANEMPAGSVLVCVPVKEQTPQQPYLAVARALRDKGVRVCAVASTRFGKHTKVPHHQL